MPTKPLTPKQRAIVDFISNYHSKYGYAPSLEEIAKKFSLRAVSTVHQHIKLIRQKGYLQKEAFQPRGITPLLPTKGLMEVPLRGEIKAENRIEIPLLGKIAAGNPLEPIENPEPIDVPNSMIQGKAADYYALKVKGDSMVDDGIWDGDIILIKYQQTMPNIGDTVVAVTNGDVTLKRFGGIRGNTVTLIPRNPTMQPFDVPAETFEVRGKFAGLIRHGQ